MGWLLFLLFTVVPVVEIALLVQIGGVIGTWPTIAVVLSTGAVGAWLARREGLRVLRDWQAAMAAGRLPAEGVLSGLLVLVGGVLLITPGMLTDVVGFSLLVPMTRRLVAKRVRAVVESRVQLHQVVVDAARGPEGWSGQRPAPRREADVIDVSVDGSS